MTLLQVRHLVRDFGGNRAVDDVSFDLAPGELLALIGPNGAGKSTVFNMLGGQLPASSGEATLDGQALLGLASHRIARLGVGRSFQLAATFGSFSVLENVQMALLASRGKSWSFWRPGRRAYRDEALALLEQVGMRDQADSPCKELAYGDVKRVELAISLAGNPRLLLMDEPTAGMGASERNALMALVKRLVGERNMAALFTEHSMDVVFGYADRILVLARGRLIAQGQEDQIRQHPDVRKVYFGSGKTFTGAEDAAVQVDAVPQQPALLTAQGLDAWYGAAHILRDVGLQVRRGEVVALLGRNGAGKSTTLKAVMGLVERRAVALDFMGHALAQRQPFEIARLGLGYVPEDRRIFTDLTVTENLMAGRQAARAWPRQAVQGIRGSGRKAAAAGHDGQSASGVITQPAAGEETLNWTLERIFDVFPHLAGLRHRPAGAMSGGEQQMLAVARTLMGNPYLLLLDEPSEGVAPVIVEQMAEMILTLKQRGVSVLLSEQNLHFARLVADRAYVLEKGEIRYQGSMQALAHDDAVRRSYLEL